jgi:hypothetical protein
MDARRALIWKKVLRLMPESEVTSEQESSAKDGNLFSAERKRAQGRNGINGGSP